MVGVCGLDRCYKCVPGTGGGQICVADLTGSLTSCVGNPCGGGGVGSAFNITGIDVIESTTEKYVSVIDNGVGGTFTITDSGSSIGTGTIVAGAYYGKLVLTNPTGVHTYCVTPSTTSQCITHTFGVPPPVLEYGCNTNTGLCERGYGGWPAGCAGMPTCTKIINPVVTITNVTWTSITNSTIKIDFTTNQSITLYTSVDSVTNNSIVAGSGSSSITTTTAYNTTVGHTVCLTNSSNIPYACKGIPAVGWKCSGAGTGICTSGIDVSYTFSDQNTCQTTAPCATGGTTTTSCADDEMPIFGKCQKKNTVYIVGGLLFMMMMMK
jgi:hypothetical protein